MKTLKLILTLCPLFLALICCSKSASDAQAGVPTEEVTVKKLKVIGYMFSHGDLDAESAKLDFDQITDLNIAFINPDATGIFTTPVGLAAAIKRAHDKNVKVFFSFAGGNPPAHIKDLLKADKRAMLVNGLLNFASTYNFDGIDVDLEGDFIDENYEAFVVQLSAGLKLNKKLMTAAVATWTGDKISNKALALYDMIHIMSYDQTGPWNTSNPGPHSTYEAAVTDFDYWNITRAIPSSMLSLGVPFYGYGFGPDIAPDLTFATIVSTYPGAETKDEVIVEGKGTIYYNGIPTIQKKVKLAKSKKAGGIMIWQLIGDATGANSLLLTITQANK